MKSFFSLGISLSVSLLVASSSIAQQPEPIATPLFDLPLPIGMSPAEPEVDIEYRATALPMPAVGAAIVAGSAVASALFFYSNVDAQGDSDFQIGGSKAGSEALSMAGEAMALTLPFSFLATLQVMKRSDPARAKTIQVTRQLFETVGLTLATTYGLKFSVDRQRPDGSDSLSFPSAHSAETFAVATVLALNYPWYVGVPSLALASAVGMSRYDLEQHYLSDIAAGAGIGAFFAVVTHLMHRQFDGKLFTKRPKNKMSLGLAAADLYGMEWRLTF